MTNRTVVVLNIVVRLTRRSLRMRKEVVVTVNANLSPSAGVATGVAMVSSASVRVSAKDKKEMTDPECMTNDGETSCCSVGHVKLHSVKPAAASPPTSPLTVHDTTLLSTAGVSEESALGEPESLWSPVGAVAHVGASAPLTVSIHP